MSSAPTLQPMRILHTADWHVGRTIRGRSRAAEHLAVLAEITAIARAEAVDLVLVAGDQFDTAAPSPEAERIVYRALLDLAEVAPVVVVGGNHDSAQRLEAVAPLLAASRVLVGATVLRPADGGVLRLDVASGESAQIALLPFVSQRGIVRAEQLMATGADEQSQRYDARLRALVGALTDGFAGDTVNLVLSHLMVAGGAVARRRDPVAAGTLARRAVRRARAGPVHRAARGPHRAARRGSQPPRRGRIS